MGLRSAAHICQRLTDCCIYMYFILGYYALNYLDDFAGAEIPSKAYEVYPALGRLLKACGLEESMDKADQPSTRMCFIGILCDTVKTTLEISNERLIEILALVNDWIYKSHANRNFGKLKFAAACVRPARFCMSRLFNFLRTLPEDQKVKRIHVEVQKDLYWWREFLPLYNGVSMMAVEEWSSPDKILATDVKQKY